MTEREDLESTVEEFSAVQEDYKSERGDYESAAQDYEDAGEEYEKTVDGIERSAGEDPDYTQADYDADKEALGDAHQKYEGSYQNYDDASQKYEGAQGDYKDAHQDYKNAAQQLLRIDLAALDDATGKISRVAAEISNEMDSIERVMNSVSGNWSGPAYETYDPVKLWFHDVQRELLELLVEIVSRMKTSHANYQDAEQKNFQNVTPEGGGQSA